MREYEKSTKTWNYRDELDEEGIEQRIEHEQRGSAALLALLQLHHDIDSVHANTVREKRGRIWDARKTIPRSASQ